MDPILQQLYVIKGRIVDRKDGKKSLTAIDTAINAYKNEKKYQKALSLLFDEKPTCFENCKPKNYDPLIDCKLCKRNTIRAIKDKVEIK